MIFQNQIIYLKLRKKTNELLDELEAWLTENNAPIPSEPNLLFSQKIQRQFNKPY